MAFDSAQTQRAVKNDARSRRQKEWHILLFLTPPEDESMNLEKLKAMSTQDLLDLYNDLTQKQVKRMASRKDAEKRVEEAARAAGKWDEPEAAGGEGEQEGGEAEAPAKGKKGKNGKANAPAKEPEPVKGKGKGKGKEAAPAKAGSSKPKGESKRGRGAPTKNPNYEPIPETSKLYNPKGMKIQPNSSRAKVLAFVTGSKAKKSREQIDAKFEGQDINVASSLYFLNKFGFIRIVE